MDALQYGVKEFLQAAAAQNWGPTRTARNTYLWFHGVATAYNWVIPRQMLVGRRDAWNWDRCYETPDMDMSPWLGFAIAAINRHFIPDYDASRLLELAGTLPDSLRATLRGNEWKLCYDTWFKSRAADGSASTAQPDIANPPLNPAVPTIAVPSPDTWSPLQIGSKIQKYLTPYWGDVTSTCLTDGEEATIVAATTLMFPSPAARAAELEELVGITGKLTDTQKITAEFWAGGPHTVSPPGMFVWFWKEYMKVVEPDLITYIKSGFDLAIHLFETARLVWACKLDFMQARPIQEIRLRLGTTEIKNWNGTGPANMWMPYQDAGFITPPFPDFPSGHSAFSQSFANVMTRWFGPVIKPGLPIPRNDMLLLSPLFKTAQTNAYGRITVEAKTSTIQPTVPRGQLTFIWTQWQHIAQSAGVSRKYGGIHCVSAHIGSQRLANTLHAILKTKLFA